MRRKANCQLLLLFDKNPNMQFVFAFRFCSDFCRKEEMLSISYWKKSIAKTKEKCSGPCLNIIWFEEIYACGWICLTKDG